MTFKVAGDQSGLTKATIVPKIAKLTKTDGSTGTQKEVRITSVNFDAGTGKTTFMVLILDSTCTASTKFMTDAKLAKLEKAFAPSATVNAVVDALPIPCAEKEEGFFFFLVNLLIKKKKKNSLPYSLALLPHLLTPPWQTAQQP